ncbi:hypothetical protein ACW4TU_40180 [Streptomyces sp. QTS52]
MSGIPPDRVVVTGATQACGREYALALVGERAQVLVNDPTEAAKAVPQDTRANDDTTAADLGNGSEGAGT